MIEQDQKPEPTPYNQMDFVCPECKAEGHVYYQKLHKPGCSLIPKIKVYLLWQMYALPYDEDQTLLAVYSTEEQAKVACDKLNKADTRKYYFYGHGVRVLNDESGLEWL